MYSTGIFILLATLACVAKNDANSQKFGFFGQNEPDARIMGGFEVTPHSYPFAVYLNPGCGGSLISPEFVLTAAHCLETPRIEVVLGAHNNEENEPGQVRFTVERSSFILHEKYGNEPDTINDIALIRLPKSVTETKTIGFAKLPSAKSELPAKASVFAIGWGYTSPIPIASPVLKGVDQKVVDKNACVERAKKYSQYIFEEHICVYGSYVSGVCTGDSGGALLFGDVLIGVTSRGIGYVNICSMFNPTVYTDVGYHLEWIRNHTNIQNA